MPGRDEQRTHHRGAPLRAGGGLLVALALAGCSLISLKSPERPLSDRDVNARLLSREFSYHFIERVAQCADEIGAAETDPVVQLNALRWKINAAMQSEGAAMRLAPMMAVLDDWTLAEQMRSFFSPGEPGGALFGAHQGQALELATELATEAEALAHRLIAPADLDRYQKFVTAYTHEHPLTSLEWLRPSVVALWAKDQPADVRLIDSVGTIPEAMADLSDRAQISGDALAQQTVWRTQLALRDAGYTGADLNRALRQLDERLAKLAAAAENAPQLVKDAVADVRRSVLDVLKRVDASSEAMIAALRVERAALAADVAHEREALVAAVDVQRRAIARDAAQIADQVVTSGGEQLRRLAREALLLMIVLTAVVLGLPFAAGFLLGRARAGRG